MRVLVVDDDPDMVMVLGLLMKVNGIIALTATGGVEGLEKARADSMPGLQVQHSEMTGGRYGKGA